MSTINPKVFISYSHTNEQHVKKVIELAERLIYNGVKVILDQWDLKPGEDLHKFMEKSVNDSSVTKVLMICDKTYVEKANDRKGGVGIETTIISPEVYRNAEETKFIPIIFEKDENNNPYSPSYLKSRTYIELLDGEEFEKNYEKLLRDLYNKPAHSKPPLGKMPEYLNEETVNFGLLRAKISEIKAFDGKNQRKVEFFHKDFTEIFIGLLLELTPAFDDNFSSNLLKQIEKALPLRNLFLEYVETIIKKAPEVDDILGDFFEQTYNRVYLRSKGSCSEPEFEFGLFLIWEMFICTTAILLYYEVYECIYKLVTRTYFLNHSPLGESTQPRTFVGFYKGFRYLEGLKGEIKGKERSFTLAGDMLTERVKIPILTKQSIANADVILYQLSEALEVKSVNPHEELIWFPKLYLSSNHTQPIWVKMVSARHCEIIFPLFGVSTVGELKRAVSKNKYSEKREVRYNHAYHSAPLISSSIRIEDIATLP